MSRFYEGIAQITIEVGMIGLWRWERFGWLGKMRTVCMIYQMCSIYSLYYTYMYMQCRIYSLSIDNAYANMNSYIDMHAIES